ncbi:unnamed protein product [Trypanosoma congolense IL3000]|uniref:WGS project CAEQ00000000 data, annotated contig 1015 n=2 Tax=Trypanosoma congolense (strain IL3000) TaxID=1068625 RepID=F9W379_TRYCI|nr:unnamed protein product [Trypanosoma congolense IL3000]
MRVVASNGDKAYFFDFNSNTDIDEVAISSQLYIGEGAKEVHLGKNHLWVTRGRTADRYSLKGDVEVTGVEASHKVVTSSSGDTLLQSVDKVIVMNHNSKTISETECRSCAASMLLSPSGEFKGQVTAEEGLDGFDIKFPSNVVHVPLKGGVAGTPAILFAVYDSDQGPWALVRARNGHLIAVSERNGEMWERWEGLGALVMTVISDSSFREDRFGLWKTALGISSYGLVYSIPFIGMGSNIRVLADISKIVLQGTGANSMESVTVEQLQVSGGNTLHVLTSFGNVKLMVDLNTLTGNMNMASKHVDSLIVTPTFDIKRSLVVKGTIPTQDLHTYTVNTTSGVIEGFLVAGATPAKLLWTVRLPFSIVAFSSGEDALRTSIVNHLRVFPNKSGSTEEVRRKFPMRNVLAVAYYEPVEDEMPTLVVTAIDTITGSVLASVRHRNVEGAVHILIVEHVVLYHFMDVEKMRHSLGVWEMLKRKWDL